MTNKYNLFLNIFQKVVTVLPPFCLRLFRLCCLKSSKLLNINTWRKQQSCQNGGSVLIFITESGLGFFFWLLHFSILQTASEKIGTPSPSNLSVNFLLHVALFLLSFVLPWRTWWHGKGPTVIYYLVFMSVSYRLRYQPSCSSRIAANHGKYT